MAGARGQTARSTGGGTARGGGRRHDTGGAGTGRDRPRPGGRTGRAALAAGPPGEVDEQDGPAALGDWLGGAARS
eukprot:3761265-Pleurochrysis_carterae.AAC.1